MTYHSSVTKKEEAPSRQRPASSPLMSSVTENRERPCILMIRLFSLFCKLNDFKFSDKKWFETAFKSAPQAGQQCPYCSAKGRLRAFGHYKRYLVEWDGHSRVTGILSVPRLICDSCGHTHALLPSCIVPYRSYSLRFLLIVLRAYFIRSCSVEQICRRYEITVSMLYRWVRLFLRQKELWLGVLDSMAASPAMFIDSIDGLLLKGFFLDFRFSFLESMYGTDLQLPLKRSDPPGSIT